MVHPYPTYRPATEADVEFLSTRLRREDVREIQAASGRTPCESLSLGLKHSSPHAITLCCPKTGASYAMCGIMPQGCGCGVVWLLATDEIKNHILPFQRTIKALLCEIWASGRYHTIGNGVHSRNHTAIDWLLRLGFKFWTHARAGKYDDLFYLFEMTIPDNYKEGHQCVT